MIYRVLPAPALWALAIGLETIQTMFFNEMRVVNTQTDMHVCTHMLLLLGRLWMASSRGVSTGQAEGPLALGEVGTLASARVGTLASPASCGAETWSDFS